MIDELGLVSSCRMPCRVVNFLFGDSLCQDFIFWYFLVGENALGGVHLDKENVPDPTIYIRADKQLLHDNKIPSTFKQWPLLTKRSLFWHNVSLFKESGFVLA